MVLAPGVRLGHFEIIDTLGAGGMGEVYKARDTRLNRTVAVKVLPGDSHTDTLARERLAREARAISALNHPNICTLYDVGHQDGIDFLVMEFVEGETLATRLARGPLPLDQALRYATELASALDRAHRARIVHRDLKPGNVIIARAGAKLLDFGLAKPFAPVPGLAVPGAGPPSDVTRSGFIVGTVQYMAPEQIEGGAVDARTDIFSLGALLYEMVSGRKAFEGTNIGTIIAAIMEKDPPRLSVVQPLAPPALDEVVATCLAKAPDERWQTARDVRRALELVTALGSASAPSPPRPGPTSNRRPAAMALAAAIAGSLLTWAVFATLDRTGGNAERPAVGDVRFSIYPETGSQFASAPASVVTAEFAISPDGAHVAYVAHANGRAMLWLRTLNSLQARVLPETDGADYPFWSPDSASLGFFSQGRLKTVSLAGGTPVTRSESSRDPRGATWAPDGTIVGALTGYGGLMNVSPQGQVEAAIFVDRRSGDANHRWPWVLPDGQHLVFQVRSSDPERRGVTLVARGESAGTRLVASDHAAAVVDNRLLFVRGRALMAQPLDLANRRLTGDAVPVVDNLGIGTTGYSAFSIAQNGALAFSGPWPVQGELTWFARDGRALGPAVTPLADYVSFDASPDGQRLALSTVDAQTGTPDVWLLDTVRGSAERVTHHPMTDANAYWSPDGTRLLFRSNRTGSNRVYSKRINDSRGEEPFDLGVSEEAAANMIISDYSDDGQHVILTNTGRATSFDIWHVASDEGRKATPVVQQDFDEYHGVLSPDNKWLAYVSNMTGAPEVYVQSFPDGEDRYRVSSQGGTEPQWRGDGRELFFLGGDQTLMAVAVTTTPAFKAGLPAPLFRVRVPVWANPYRQQYAVSRDGQRFLINTMRDDVAPLAIHVVLDWRALIRGR